MHKEGLTYFTVEPETSAMMISIKKKIERYFWDFSRERWETPRPESDNSTFTFSICAAGNQSERINLRFHCGSYRGGCSLSAAEADAVWYIADAPLFDATIAGDPYREYLRSVLCGVDTSKKPVCLLVSQIENQTHFEKENEVCRLSFQAKKQLFAQCRETFIKRDNERIALIPIQIYGGIEYVGTDETGSPKLHLGTSGYYQSYIPENCQIPILYSLATIMAINEVDYLLSASCGSMKKAIHHHYGVVKSDSNWLPEML